MSQLAIPIVAATPPPGAADCPGCGVSCSGHRLVGAEVVTHPHRAPCGRLCRGEVYPGRCSIVTVVEGVCGVCEHRTGAA